MINIRRLQPPVYIKTTLAIWNFMELNVSEGRLHGNYSTSLYIPQLTINSDDILMNEIIRGNS